MICSVVVLYHRCVLHSANLMVQDNALAFLSQFELIILFPIWQGGFILDMGVHFIAGLRMVSRTVHYEANIQPCPCNLISFN